MSLKRSISRTHRFINLTPFVNVFGVDGFKIRVSNDAGRFIAKNSRKSIRILN